MPVSNAPFLDTVVSSGTPNTPASVQALLAALPAARQPTALEQPIRHSALRVPADSGRPRVRRHAELLYRLQCQHDIERPNRSRFNQRSVVDSSHDGNERLSLRPDISLQRYSFYALVHQFCGEVAMWGQPFPSIRPLDSYPASELFGAWLKVMWRKVKGVFRWQGQ
jgi:hypothetical protein